MSTNDNDRTTRPHGATPDDTPTAEHRVGAAAEQGVGATAELRADVTTELPAQDTTSIPTTDTTAIPGGATAFPTGTAAEPRTDAPADPLRPWAASADAATSSGDRSGDGSGDWSVRRTGTPSDAGPTVWSAATVPAVAEPRGVRTGTLVLGLILALCGAAGIAVGLGYEVDLQLTAIVGLVAIALVLLVVPFVQPDRKR